MLEDLVDRVGGRERVALEPVVVGRDQHRAHLVRADLTAVDGLGPVAGHPVAVGHARQVDDPQLRPLVVAPGLLAPRAAGVEPAPGRRGGSTGRAGHR